MSEDKVVNILNSIGLGNNQNVSDEDYNVFVDYFAERCLSSDDESSDIEENEQEDIVNISDNSLLRNIPKVNDISEGNFENLVDIDDVIIEIESANDNVELVDQNDGGQNLVTIDETINLVDTYDSDKDRNTVSNFLETGCGCNDKCCNLFSADELLLMRYECAELDHYHNNVNTLDQIILGQLRCLTSDS